MATKCRAEDFPWLGMGGTCFVYEVNAAIVVKVRRSGDFEEEQFAKEVDFYRLLTRHPSCPQLPTCFLASEDVIFLEYMKDIDLDVWMQGMVYYRGNSKSRQVVAVKRREPLSLRLQWMIDLAEAVAFLESLGMAHGDLRPENVLLDRGRLKLSDFDCTVVFGQKNEVCGAPWGRLPSFRAGPDEGSEGCFSPQSEQFSLGSLFYAINYGVEPYGDQVLGDDPLGRNHYIAVTDLMENMILPELHGTPAIDVIIDNCWHGRYATVAELVKDLSRTVTELVGSCEPPVTMASDDFELRRAICQQMVQDGIFEALSGQDPVELRMAPQRNYQHVCTSNVLLPFEAYSGQLLGCL